jgi:hypothetical protein
MTLSTGTPGGLGTSQEEIYIEGAPTIFFQDYRATPLFNPDAQGYHWGLSGTVAYPWQELGCITDVKLTEDVTMNDVRCDTVGVKDTIQKRNYVEFSATIVSLFPFSVLSKLMNLSPATVTTGVETVGIGQIDNTIHYMVYAPKVYSETDNDWLMFHLHKAKFVDAWELPFTYGEAWKMTGIKIRAYADDTKNAKELFGVIRRVDQSAIP